MNPEPRNKADYSTRQTVAARRVLVDVGQVLAAFVDCLVVVGGWTPDLLLPDPETQAMHARRAYELVQKFLSML